tara:strand:- start:145 stop:531 length:387 start_codon:yes stop_codon:yes gene_type:complete
MSALQDRIDLLQKEIESLKTDIKLEQEPILCNHPAISFEVYPDDLGQMDWDKAKKACADLGDGWRLPTRLELLLMYNQEDHGGFANNFYWSSTEFDNLNAWVQSFSFGYQGDYLKSNGFFYVRAVRTR